MLAGFVIWLIIFNFIKISSLENALKQEDEVQEFQNDELIIIEWGKQFLFCFFFQRKTHLREKWYNFKEDNPVKIVLPQFWKDLLLEKTHFF